MPKRKRRKRNNISLHQRIQCALEWQRWLEAESRRKKKGRVKKV